MLSAAATRPFYEHTLSRLCQHLVEIIHCALYPHNPVCLIRESCHCDDVASRRRDRSAHRSWKIAVSSHRAICACVANRISLWLRANFIMSEDATRFSSPSSNCRPSFSSQPAAVDRRVYGARANSHSCTCVQIQTATEQRRAATRTPELLPVFCNRHKVHTTTVCIHFNHRVRHKRTGGGGTTTPQRPTRTQTTARGVKLTRPSCTSSLPRKSHQLCMLAEFRWRG